MSKLLNFPSPHCHVQSLDSASTPEAFADREIELGTGTFTCTDHGTMGACNEVVTIAKEKGLIAIPGLEGYVRDDDCSILKDSGITKDEKGTYAGYQKYQHITLHATDNAAYEALVKELSKADFRAEQHGSERKPLFTWSQLETLGQYNLTMTSGCLIGMVQRHLLNDRPDIAIKYYERLRSIPKAGNFFVEIFPHKCDQYWESGIFITLEGGEKLRFWKQKKLKTTEGEFSAEDMAKLFSRGKPLGSLVGIRNYSSWDEREPKAIVKAELIEGFLQNECRPWCPDGDVQLGANKFVLGLSKRYGDKVLISDDAHFARPEEKIVQDSRLGGAGGSWKFANSYHRMGSDEAFKYFSTSMDISESEYTSWVENNREWGQRFKDFNFVERKSLPTKFYPDNTVEHLKTLIDKHGRMNWSDPAMVKRLKSEINLLRFNETTDLLPYFFLAEEVNYFYEQSRLLTGPGRGSAAGLLTTYLLGITHVDPLEYNLSQDRFMTLERVKSGRWPDIDMDFSDRDPLLDPQTGWLYRRFGDHVAAVSTNTMLRLKSSIKDVCRAKLGYVDADVETLCRKLPNPPQGVDDADFIFGYEGDDGKEVKGLFEESKELQAYAAARPEEWAIVRKMLGIARQKSRHACAYVIANEPISNFIPLTSISGVRTTQYTAKSVEARGGLKMDFLGVNSLKDIQACIAMIQERNSHTKDCPGPVCSAHQFPLGGDQILSGKRVPYFRIVPFAGVLYDVWNLPKDQAVFNDISEAKTDTVFQLNTASAKQWLKQFNYEKSPGRKAIDSIEAMSAFTALDRPGPLDAEVKDPVSGKSHNMLQEFANRAKGHTPIGNLPALDKMLPETYGIMVYQEQLEAVFRELSGCTAAQAEDFRRNVAKKEMEKVKKSYPAFMAGATARFGKEQAQAVFDQMVTFGQYGFNKSHSVCYMVIAYACAFLKHHYPLEWWTAVLRNANKKEVSEKFWKFCKHQIDLPDITHSGDVFEIKNERIRAPLSFINGVGPNAHKELTEGRPFENIHDFCRKINLHKRAGAKPAVNKDGTPKLDPKTGQQTTKLGSSSLNGGIVSRLIVSGVADSLFPPEMSTLEKLQAYHAALAETANELFKTKKKPGKVDPKYIELTPLARYQMQKLILPIYTQNLGDLLSSTNFPGLKVSETGGAQVGRAFSYFPTTAEEVDDLVLQKGNDRLPTRFPVLNGEQVKFLNSEPIEEGEHLTAVAFGYVLAERRFSYSGGSKTALDLTLDIDGEQFSFVRWPDRKTGTLVAPKDDLTGAIVLVMITRFRSDRPFTLDAIKVIQPPLSDGKDTDDDA